MATTTTLSTNVQIVEQLYDAFARGDIGTVLGAFDPDIEWTSSEGAAYPGTFCGPDAILQNIFMRLGTEWEGFGVEVQEFIDGGDQVVMLGRYSGTYRETGKSMSAGVAHVWTLRDGRIVRYRQYVDSRKMAEAL